MVFIGMDHGTTGISFCIMSDEGDVADVFKIGREESKQGLVSASEELKKRVNLEDVKLIRFYQQIKSKIEGFCQSTVPARLPAEEQAFSMSLKN